MTLPTLSVAHEVRAIAPRCECWHIVERHNPVSGKCQYCSCVRHMASLDEAFKTVIGELEQRGHRELADRVRVMLAARSERTAAGRD